MFIKLYFKIDDLKKQKKKKQKKQKLTIFLNFKK